MLRSGLLLFAVGLAVRLLFDWATPDSAWPYSAVFKGDALVWLDYAQSLRAGTPFELGLPIHPPGTGYLLSWMWDGSENGFAAVRFLWAAFGAAAVALFSLAAARSFGTRAATLTGWMLVGSSGLIFLSSSLNAEAPYLVLVAGSFVLFEDLVPRPRLGPLAGWAGLQGLACLFRVEHSLFVLGMLGLLAIAWWRSSRSPRLVATGLGLALVAFLAPLVPWHVRAWSAIGRFNTTEIEAAEARRVEARSGLPWDPAALERLEALPAFARPIGAGFVAATVRHRGGERVRPEDFEVLREAFDYVPRPLGRFPFVSCYGALNFALANNAAATGGFSPALLEAPPRLLGGSARYPAALVAGLPPPQLALVYPPHLRLLNEGYALGAAWIAHEPAAFAALALRKLGIFWSGAALGMTGFDWPLGLSGTRRAVDLATPGAGLLAWVWRLALGAGCLAGAVAGRARFALWPWLLFLLSKLATTLLFFGYARLGATTIPVMALLLALAAERWLWPRLPASARGVRAVAVVAILLVAAEAARFLVHPELRIDGREVVGAGDAFGADVHRDQQLTVTYLR